MTATASARLSPIQEELLAFYATNPNDILTGDLWRRARVGTWDALKRAGYLTSAPSGRGWMVTDAGYAHLAASQAAKILSAKVGDQIDTLDGPMYVKTAGWSKETGVRLDAARAANPDLDVRAFLGRYEHALLVSAPKARVHADGWCGCGDSTTADRWVRYEKYTAKGRVGHGWACPDCGGIT